MRRVLIVTAQSFPAAQTNAPTYDSILRWGIYTLIIGELQRVAGILACSTFIVTCILAD